MKEKTIRVDEDVWQILKVLAKKQRRTLKGTIKFLAEEANK